MSDAIIVAIITAGIGLLGTVITVIVSNNKTINVIDRRSELADKEIEGKLKEWKALIDTKIDHLTHTVEKHNQLIERTYKLEGEMQEVQHDIRDLKDKK